MPEKNMYEIMHMGIYKEKQRRDMWKCLNFGTL